MFQVLFGTLIFIFVPVYLKIKKSTITLSTAALFAIEAIALFSIWTPISILFTLKDYPFDVAVKIYCLIVCIGYITVILYTSLRKQHSYHKTNSPISTNKLLCITTFCIIAYQIIRAAYFQPYEYRDSKTYIAVINDILQTNRFFLLSDSNGSVLIEQASPKYALSGWYTFEAMISYVSGIHPLIVVNTILSPLMLLLSYISYWLLSEVLFETQYRKRLTFLLVIALLFQFLTEDTSILFLIWPTWGKNLILSITIPLYLFFYSTPNLGAAPRHFLLTLTGLCACFISTIGVILLPVLIIGLKLYNIISNKCVKAADILSFLLLLSPVAIYATAYILW